MITYFLMVDGKIKRWRVPRDDLKTLDHQAEYLIRHAPDTRMLNTAIVHTARQHFDSPDESLNLLAFIHGFVYRHPSYRGYVAQYRSLTGFVGIDDFKDGSGWWCDLWPGKHSAKDMAKECALQTTLAARSRGFRPEVTDMSLDGLGRRTMFVPTKIHDA